MILQLAELKQREDETICCTVKYRYDVVKVPHSVDEGKIFYIPQIEVTEDEEDIILQVLGCLFVFVMEGHQYMDV